MINELERYKKLLELSEKRIEDLQNLKRAREEMAGKSIFLSTGFVEPDIELMGIKNLLAREEARKQHLEFHLEICEVLINDNRKA